MYPCSCGGGSFRSGVQPPTGSGGDSTSPPLRGWIVPVGDAIPDRLRGDSTSPPLRGWIVPVGGSTPDRLREGTPLLRPCGGGSFRSGVQPPTGSGGGLHFPAPAGVDRSGRGFNPRPAQSRGATPDRLKVPAQSSGSRSRFKVPAQGLGSKAGLGAV